MSNLKIALVLLLTLALLAAGACLPAMAAAVRDWQTLGRASTQAVSSVSLTIRQETPALGKLAMMCRQDGVLEVTESACRLTTEEVEELAYAVLEPYAAAGLITQSPEKFTIYEIRPLLPQVPEDPELAGIVWDITMVGSNVSLLIDDESGKLLLINYSAGIEYGRQDLLDTFVDIYFTELGITDYAGFVTDDLDGEYVGDNAVGVRYRFGDAVYGEINVDFNIYKYGFYMAFVNP